MAGLINVKSQYTVAGKLRPRPAVKMYGYGVGEVSTGAGEQVDGMVNGTSLTPCLQQDRELVGMFK